MNQYDKLKSKFNKYKVDIDKDKLWKNTSHAIPKRKRRPVAFIMVFAGLVFSGWLLYSASLWPLSASRSSLNSTQNINPDSPTQNLQGYPSGNPDEGKESQINTIELSSSKLSGSVTKLVSQKNALAPDHESKTKTESETIFLKNAKEQNEMNQRVALVNSGMHNHNSLPPLNKTEIEKIEKQNIQGFKNVNPDQKDRSLSLQHQAENDLKTSIPEVDIPVDFLFAAVSQIPITTNTVAAPATQANIQPLKGKWLQSIQMVQAIGFSSIQIHALKPETAESAAQLEEKMRSLEILSTTATASFRLPEGFSLEAGTQWTRLSTVIDHTWEINERIAQEGITAIIIDEHGVQQPVIGSTDVTHTTHYHAKRYSEHQDIDVVLALHKEIWNAHRLSLNAFVKGAYLLSYQAKGTILTAGDELIGFSKDENPFKRNILFALGGGVQINYHLRPHLNFTGSLTFDQHSYQYKDPILPIRFQHSGFSAGIGIGYIF